MNTSHSADKNRRSIKKAHSSTPADYHELKKELLEWYPNDYVPNVEKLEKNVAGLETKKVHKNVQYKAIKLKADKPSQATNEIKQYLRQEQSRNQLKKHRQNELE